MDSLRKVEEDLRGLTFEFKKKYPEVLDAAERALATLKTMREMYVADKMSKRGAEKEDVKIPQSSDILAPYILACNYVDANPKLLLMALNGIQILVAYEVIPLGDIKNVLRVFTIQATSGKFEIQLKILQIVLQLVTSLSTSDVALQYLTESTVNSFLGLTMGMCGPDSSMSVTSTALATTRQIITIVMDALNRAPSSSSSSLSTSALSLVKDLLLYIKGGAGEWVRGLQVPQNAAFDLLDYVMTGWKDIFVDVPVFRCLLKDAIFPVLKPLLRDLRDDFTQILVKDGLDAASAFSTRVVRFSRFYLLHFAVLGDIDEIDIIITFMIHTLTSDVDIDNIVGNTRNGVFSGLDRVLTESTGTSMIGDATALIGGFTKRLQMPFSNTKEKANVSSSNNSLQTSFLTVKRPASHSTFIGGQDDTQTTPSRVLCHPAGACLEALIAFFLMDMSPIFQKEGGLQLITSTVINTLTITTSLISQALSIQSNSKILEDVSADSRLLILLENLLTGTVEDVESTKRSIFDTLQTTSSISGADTLILAFYLIQISSRLLVKFSISSVSKNGSGCSNSSLFLEKINISFFPPKFHDNQDHVVQTMEMARKICECTYECIQEACTTVLTYIKLDMLVSRSVRIISEIAMSAGILKLNQPSEVMISSLCKFTVPKWHGHDSSSSESNDTNNELNEIRIENMIATYSLCQVVHVLADCISDWDTIVDAFEQISNCVMNPKTFVGSGEKRIYTDSVLRAIERFKKFTAFLSDNSLIKLMTSLVAMSLNSLAVTAKSTTSSSSSPKGDSSKGMQQANSFSADFVSISLQTAVEITKFNTYRISCVWQMVTSHLNMIASLKSPKVRSVAVTSTHDLVSCALKYLQNPNAMEIDIIDENNYSSSNSDITLLTDSFLNNQVMPHFGSSFSARKYHQEILQGRINLPSVGPTLSQGDLLSSLKFLAGIRFDDVKVDSMSGLLNLLQSGGEILGDSGWGEVIGLIAAVPLSFLEDAEDEEGPLTNSENIHQNWPIASLSISFNCMKLIVDEYMDFISLGQVTSLISCLSYFSSQLDDVNISLTSLEMLWKVYDQMMRSLKDNTSASMKEIFSITTQQLLSLSMDTRPEIRHCAMNTLFAALTMTANASLTTGNQWKQVFDEVVFPLFEKAGERSNQAMEQNEAAIAPELKKGKKMILHHSRDTAHKQWSETRVLALRGLARVVKTCANFLIQESWFKSTWTAALVVCKKASQVVDTDQEVAIASLDVMFAMLKIVSVGNFKTYSKANLKMDEATELCRNDLWQSTWTAVNDSAKFSGHSPDVSLHTCQNMISIYEGAAENEFRNIKNLQDICDSVVTLGRSKANLKSNHIADMQLHRMILDFLKVLKPSNQESASLISSTFAELCFASLPIKMKSSTTSRDSIHLNPCPSKFRKDVGDYFIKNYLEIYNLENVENVKNAKKGNSNCYENQGSLMDTVFTKFITGICGPSISLRSSSMNYDLSNSPQKEKKTNNGETEKKSVNFFSFITGGIDGDDFAQNEAEEEDEEYGDDFLNSELPKSPKPGANGENLAWTTFHPLNVEMQVLTKALEICSSDDAKKFNEISESTRENIFSSLLCIMSPWRVCELPEAASYGAVSAGQQSGLVTHAVGILHNLACQYPESGWMISLISTIIDATRLQIHAMSTEMDVQIDENEMNVNNTTELWTKITEILVDAVSTSKEKRIRQAAAESLMHLSKDASLALLQNENQTLLTKGCIIFLKGLVKIKVQLEDLPTTFSLQKSTEKGLLTNWITNITTMLDNSNNEEDDQVSDTIVESEFNTGHLLIFLPIAFKLAHTNSNDEIKNIANTITSSVDIAAFMSSYTQLLAEVKSLR